MIGQQDEQPRVGEARDQSRQLVVVAEFYLFGRDGVVFVDDGHHAQAQQGQQGVARVEIAPAVAQVVGGQQNLRDRDAVRRERGLPGPHQPALTDRGRGLLPFRAGLVFERERFAAGQDRTRGDDDDLTPRLARGDQFSGQSAQGRGVEPRTAAGQHPGTKLDHDAPGRRDGGVCTHRACRVAL